MGDFNGKIELRANTSMTYSFKFPTATSATANDGWLPYGRTIIDVDVYGYSEDGSNVTSALIVGTPSISTDTITVKLRYPGEVGRYEIEFHLTLDNGDTDEAEFTNIFAVDN